MLSLHVSVDEAWAAASVVIVGALTPAFVAIVNHPIWQSQTRRIISIVCAVILGILTVIGNGILTNFEVTIPSVVTMVFAVVGASQTAYTLFKPTGVIEKIETTINPGPDVPGV